MKNRPYTRRRPRSNRYGMMALEVVMTIGVTVLVAGILFFLGVKSVRPPTKRLVP